MATPASLVAAQLRKFGEPATLVWDTPGVDVAPSSGRLSTHVLFDHKQRTQRLGQLNGKAMAMMPITTRDITNARLIVGKKSYQVISFTIIANTYQEVELAWLS